MFCEQSFSRLFKGILGHFMKIMLIDDSKTIRKSVELYMKESGYEIILAADDEMAVLLYK